MTYNEQTTATLQAMHDSLNSLFDEANQLQVDFYKLSDRGVSGASQIAADMQLVKSIAENTKERIRLALRTLNASVVKQPKTSSSVANTGL